MHIFCCSVTKTFVTLQEKGKGTQNNAQILIVSTKEKQESSPPDLLISSKLNK